MADLDPTGQVPTRLSTRPRGAAGAGVRVLRRVISATTSGGLPRVRQLAWRFVAAGAVWFLLSLLLWQPHQAVDRRIVDSLAWAVAELVGDLFFFRPSPSAQQRAVLARHVRTGTLPDDDATRRRLAAYVADDLSKRYPLWRTAAVFGGLGAAAVAYGVVRGGTGQVTAGLVVGLALISLVPRERVEVRRLERMDRLLDPGRERPVRAAHATTLLPSESAGRRQALGWSGRREGG